jgi:hypothetical protein
VREPFDERRNRRAPVEEDTEARNLKRESENKRGEMKKNKKQNKSKQLTSCGVLTKTSSLM